jgi:hypothetical protein
MSDKLQGGVPAGATSVSLSFLLRKSADSTEQTGKVAADMTLSYWRQGATRTSITASDLSTVNSAWASGGVKEVDSTNMPGAYRVDVPDAAFASGTDWVQFSVKVAGCFVYQERIPITSNVVQTGDAYARLGAAGAGLTALGDTRIANLDAAVSSRSTFAGGAVASVTADVGITQAAADKVWGSAARTLTSFGTLVADMATAVWGAATRILTAGTNLNDLNAAGVRTAIGLASANLDTQLSGINAKTTNLPAAPADESLIIAAASSLASSIAALPNAITVNAIKAKTDNLPAAPAAVGDIPTAAQNAAAKFDLTDGVEPGLTEREAWRLLTAAAGGTSSGLETTNPHFKSIDGTKTRIIATVDTNGNTTAATLDLS